MKKYKKIDNQEKKYTEKLKIPSGKCFKLRIVDSTYCTHGKFQMDIDL